MVVMFVQVQLYEGYHMYCVQQLDIRFREELILAAQARLMGIHNVVLRILEGSIERKKIKNVDSILSLFYFGTFFESSFFKCININSRENR